jgi:hypothetical protein
MKSLTFLPTTYAFRCSGDWAVANLHYARLGTLSCFKNQMGSPLPCLSEELVAPPIAGRFLMTSPFTLCLLLVNPFSPPDLQWLSWINTIRSSFILPFYTTSHFPPLDTTLRTTSEHGQDQESAVCYLGSRIVEAQVLIVPAHLVHPKTTKARMVPLGTYLMRAIQNPQIRLSW